MDKKAILEQLILTAEIIGSRKISDNAYLMMIDDFNQNGINNQEVLLKALHKIRADYQGNLSLKLINEYYYKCVNDSHILQKLDYKETAEEKARREEYSRKCLKIIQFMGGCKDFAEKMQAFENVENLSFLDKARRILQKDDDLRRQAVAFFEERKAQQAEKDHFTKIGAYL